MDKLIFSQTGVYRLHQLANQVRSITGVRHKLSDESGMLELLRCCATSDHEDIQRSFIAFTAELNHEQRKRLLARLAARRAA